MREIESAEYSKTLRELLSRKARETTDADLFVKRQKVARFAIGKGYEPDMVWEILKDMLPE